MKCPMCGKEKFICPNDDKFISFGEQHLTVKGYVCLNCGHIEFNASNLVASYKDLKERILFLKNEIKDLESKKEKIDLKIKKNKPRYTPSINRHDKLAFRKIKP